MDKINVGIVGCGRISDLHALGYKDNAKSRIYAVCDTNKELAEQRLKQWHAEKYYTGFDEMLADSALDAVEILTPHSLHESMVIKAAGAKKHIAVQKPMTTSLKSADRMLNAVKKAGIVYKVTDNYVFYPPIVCAKNMILNGEIGTPTNLRIKFVSGGSGGWDVAASSWEWRLKEHMQGRGLQTFDHGHHLWAAAWFLLGEVERVVGWIDAADGIIDCPSVIMWKYKDGIKYGMCEYTHAMDLTVPSKYYSNDEWIEITGSKGIILINRCTGNIKEGPAVSLFTSNGWKHFDIASDWAEGFKAATANFVAAIREGQAPLLSGDKARAVLKFSLAVQRSSKLRREVYVDEMDSKSPARYTRQKISAEIKAKKPLKSEDVQGNYAMQARSLTLDLVNKLNPLAVQDWKCNLGIHLSVDGNVPEMKFSIIIANGSARIEEGILPKDARLLIKASAGIWAAILLGKQKIEIAFMEGNLKLEGKAEEGLKLKDAFGL